MVLTITQFGNPVLRQPGVVITEITDELRTLAADMMDTMKAANGVGLAAQQVGRALQLCVLDVPYMEDRPSRMWVEGEEVDMEKLMPMVLMNPELNLNRKQEVGTEGCLSFPEIHGEVARPQKAKVKALGIDGKTIKFEAEGLLARAVQHEVDHLNGVLFIDRMDAPMRRSIKRQTEALREQTLGQLAQQQQ